MSEGELAEARQAVAEVEHKLRESEQLRAGIEHRAESVRGQLEQQRISNQTLRVQRENILRQLNDDEQDLEAVLARFARGRHQSPSGRGSWRKSATVLPGWVP